MTATMACKAAVKAGDKLSPGRDHLPPTTFALMAEDSATTARTAGPRRSCSAARNSTSSSAGFEPQTHPVATRWALPISSGIINPPHRPPGDPPSMPHVPFRASPPCSRCCSPPGRPRPSSMKPHCRSSRHRSQSEEFIFVAARGQGRTPTSRPSVFTRCRGRRPQGRRRRSIGCRSTSRANAEAKKEGPREGAARPPRRRPQGGRGLRQQAGEEVQRDGLHRGDVALPPGHRSTTTARRSAGRCCSAEPYMRRTFAGHDRRAEDR